MHHPLDEEEERPPPVGDRPVGGAHDAPATPASPLEGACASGYDTTDRLLGERWSATGDDPRLDGTRTKLDFRVAPSWRTSDMPDMSTCGAISSGFVTRQGSDTAQPHNEQREVGTR